MPSETLVNTSPSLAASLMPVKKSPIVAVTVRSLSAKNPAPVRRGAKALKTATAPCRTRSRTEKRPLKVRCNLSAVSSEMTKRSEKLRSVSVSAYSWSEVAGGKISRNASLIGVITLTKPLAAFQIDSIKFSRPDGFKIFSVNSSMEMEPSRRPSASVSICSTISEVYPAALRSSWDMPDIFP